MRLNHGYTHCHPMYLSGRVSQNFPPLPPEEPTVLPPLDQFSQLPWEIQVMIIDRAIGSDLAESLEKMSLISRAWRDYVTDSLWPRFLAHLFTQAQIDSAIATLNHMKDPVTNLPEWITPQKIYRLLSKPPVTYTNIGDEAETIVIQSGRFCQRFVVPPHTTITVYIPDSYGWILADSFGTILSLSISPGSNKTSYHFLTETQLVGEGGLPC